jgi:hypothetical protein
MNFIKLFLFLTSFLLVSIPVSAEAKNINFTSSEEKYPNLVYSKTKPYFFTQQKKPRISSSINTTTYTQRKSRKKGTLPFYRKNITRIKKVL